MKFVALRCSIHSPSTNFVAVARKACRFAAATVLAVALSASVSEAGTLSSWSGGGSNSNWGTASNFSTPVTTTGTFSLVFAGQTRVTSTNNIGTVSIDALSFTNNGSVGRTAAFTLRGQTLQLVNAAVSTTEVTTGTITNVIATPVTNVGTTTFTLGNRHNISVSGPVSGGSIVKTGLGSLTLSGSVSSTTFSVSQGTLAVSGAAISGVNGTVVDLSNAGPGSGGIFAYSPVTGSSGTSTAQFRLTGNGQVSVINGGSILFSNPSFNVPSAATSGTLTLGGGAGALPGSATIAGSISDNSGGPLSVSVVDRNVWTLGGLNTYTGPTTGAAGSRLLVNGLVGSGGVTSHGYLGGSGLVSGAVTMVNSSTLSPGGSSTTPGVLTETIGQLTVGSLSLGATTRTQFTIGGLVAAVDYDQLVGSSPFSSSVNYGGTLAVTLSGTQSYAKDTTFNLFKDFATRTGNFSSVTLAATGTPYDGLVFSNMGGGIWETGTTGFPLGSGFKFDESTGDLVVVPEPSTFVLAGLGVAMAGVQFWRRRRVANA